jgi:hypothetical protein
LLMINSKDFPAMSIPLLYVTDVVRQAHRRHIAQALMVALKRKLGREARDVLLLHETLCSHGALAFYQSKLGCTNNLRIPAGTIDFNLDSRKIPTMQVILLCKELSSSSVHFLLS